MFIDRGMGWGSGCLLILLIGAVLVIPHLSFAADEKSKAPLAMPTTDTVYVDVARVPVGGHDLRTSGVLTVEFLKFRNDKGLVRVAVFGSDAGWPGEWSKSAVAYTATKITTGCASLKFIGLPAGSYGITAYHDENGNGRCDSNVLGIPTEGYGFSRITGMILSTPKLKSAMFQFSGKDSRETITMRY